VLGSFTAQAGAAAAGQWRCRLDTEPDADRACADDNSFATTGGRGCGEQKVMKQPCIEQACPILVGFPLGTAKVCCAGRYREGARSIRHLPAAPFPAAPCSAAVHNAQKPFLHDLRDDCELRRPRLGAKVGTVVTVDRRNRQQGFGGSSGFAERAQTVPDKRKHRPCHEMTGRFGDDWSNFSFDGRG
jgi:hypothetical protein